MTVKAEIEIFICFKHFLFGQHSDQINLQILDSHQPGILSPPILLSPKSVPHILLFNQKPAFISSIFPHICSQSYFQFFANRTHDLKVLNQSIKLSKPRLKQINSVRKSLTINFKNQLYQLIDKKIMRNQLGRPKRSWNNEHKFHTTYFLMLYIV